MLRPHFPALLAGLVGSLIPSLFALFYKPAPTIVQPQTTIVTRTAPDGAKPGIKVEGVGGPGALTTAEKRQLAAQWGDLDQKEVDALAITLKSLPKAPLTIFCEDDSKCGDMQLSFDNAFETAHWDTKLEKPMIDDTFGIGTSREDLRQAINEATGGRLAVKIIAKNAPYEVLVIGKKAGQKRAGADILNNIDRSDKEAGAAMEQKR